MDALLGSCTPGALDHARFEVRRSASGVDVVCARSERPWDPHARATSAVDVAAGVAAAFASSVQLAAHGATGAAQPPPPPPHPRTYAVSTLSLEERYASVRLVGEECVQVRCTSPRGGDDPAGTSLGAPAARRTQS